MPDSILTPDQTTKYVEEIVTELNHFGYFWEKTGSELIAFWEHERYCVDSRDLTKKYGLKFLEHLKRLAIRLSESFEIFLEYDFDGDLMYAIVEERRVPDKSVLPFNAIVLGMEWERYQQEYIYDQNRPDKKLASVLAAARAQKDKNAKWERKRKLAAVKTYVEKHYPQGLKNINLTKLSSEISDAISENDPILRVLMRQKIALKPKTIAKLLYEIKKD